MEHLQEIEYNLDSHWQTLDKAKKAKQEKRKPDDQTSDPWDSQSSNHAPRKDRGPGSEQQKKQRGNYTIECYYCHKLGHMEYECQKKKVDQEKKKNEGEEKETESKN